MQEWHRGLPHVSQASTGSLSVHSMYGHEQVEQVSHAVPPFLLWKLPATHGVHSSALAFSAKVPEAHGVGDVAPSRQDAPAGQAWQSSCDLSPVVLP